MFGDISRELPAPCDRCAYCHWRIRWSWCRGSASQAADGITANHRRRRNRGRHGVTGRVGDLLLAGVLELGRAKGDPIPLGRFAAVLVLIMVTVALAACQSMSSVKFRAR